MEGRKVGGGTIEEGVSGTGFKGVISPLLRICQSTSVCATTDADIPSSNTGGAQAAHHGLRRIAARDVSATIQQIAGSGWSQERDIFWQSQTVGP
jgi:hypothetical protein